MICRQRGDTQDMDVVLNRLFSCLGGRLRRNWRSMIKLLRNKCNGRSSSSQIKNFANIFDLFAK